MTEEIKAPKHCKINEDGSLQVTLKKGLQIDGTRVTEVTMREPMLRDQLQAAKAVQNVEDREIYIIALLLGQAPNDIETISSADWNRLQIAYGFFID